MKYATIFISFLVLIHLYLPAYAIGQSFTDASPVMTKKLLKDFIHAHLVYPEKARENKTEGTVEIKFRIDENGKIMDRWVKNSVSPEIDKSALHLFDLIIWKPAKEYGIPVKSTGEFEILYHLKKYAKYVKSRGYDQINPEGFETDTSYTVYRLAQLTEPPTPITSKDYKGLNDFIISEMNYPEEAQRLGIKGSVALSFIIEANGIPSNIFVEEYLGGGCCEESIRILKLVKWTPGVKDDLYVRTSYEMTIHFNSEGDHRTLHIPNQSNSGL